MAEWKQLFKVCDNGREEGDSEDSADEWGICGMKPSSPAFGPQLESEVGHGAQALGAENGPV